MRELGIQLVDGRMPGFAAILGPAPTTEIAVKVVRQLQQRSILSFLCANRDGKTMREQMVEGGVLKDDAPLEECWDLYVVPVGPETLDTIYVLNWSIRSALTFGGHKRGESRKVSNAYLAGELDFLFIAPERLGVPGFPELLARRKPELVAIDEAHCISQWGHDFRPEYVKLGELRHLFPEVPMIAVTATADHQTQADVVQRLHLQFLLQIGL